ncbi:MAG: hypothetical protein HFI89_12020 [Lachnospiraceae bacterium]|nr:hypothetical protein [Lachnospiraceae bacterium]
MINIYFFGDSISFGQGISIEKNWVTKIGNLLNDGGQKVLIQNPSVNGNTTRMALERMPFDIQSHAVDFLIVTFGLNDCNYWLTDKGVPRVSPQGFEVNMKEIINRAFTFGVREVIVHTNHPSPRKDLMSGTDITYNQSNELYNAVIRKVASDCKKVRFVDIYKTMMKLVELGCRTISDFTQEDGIHLSETGNDIYYKEIGNLLKSMVSEISHT